MEVLPRYYSARQQLCASLFSVSRAICAQAFRRRSAVEEKRGPGAEGTGCSGLQRMPASAEEVMSGSEEEDAGPPPMMREDDDVVLWVGEEGIVGAKKGWRAGQKEPGCSPCI